MDFLQDYGSLCVPVPPPCEASSGKKIGPINFDIWKQYEIGRKYNTSFRLLPKVVNLNDLESRNGHFMCIFRRQANYVRLAKARPIVSETRCSAIAERPHCRVLIVCDKSGKLKIGDNILRTL